MLRVLLIDDGAHRISLIHDELTHHGHLVVGVADSVRLARPSRLDNWWRRHGYPKAAC